jgi:hypothetical protein
VTRANAWILPLVLSACVFGGPTADGNGYQTPPEANAGTSSGGEPIGTEGASGAQADVDAGGATDAVPERSVDTSLCQVTVPVCDPVHDTGCSPLQCDVDLLQTVTPTGRCVFRDAFNVATCVTSPFAQSCEPGSTCVDGACRSLCHCDADCPAAQCCTDGFGATGFRLCQPCE